jgi:general stress protein YciG
LLREVVAESSSTTGRFGDAAIFLRTSEEVTMNDRDNAKARGRGFASMDADKQRSIASLGGRAAHRLGTAHEFSSDEAREAGRKGGEAVSANRAHMAAIGRKGGEASHRGSAKRNDEAQVQQQPTTARIQPSRDYDSVRDQASQF